MKKSQKPPLQQELISTIFSSTRIIYTRMHEKGIPCLGSPLQRETLRFINENEGVVMKDIAKYLQIKPPSATSIINNLVKVGLIRRQLDCHDRRIVRLFITKKGDNFFHQGIAHMNKRLSKLSMSEKKNLIKILRKIAIIQ